MSPKSANTIVLVSGGGLAVYTLLRAPKTEGATYRALWAIGLVTLGLGIAADFVPEIVGPFAILILIAAVLRNEGKLGKVLRKPPQQSAARPRAGRGVS